MYSTHDSYYATTGTTAVRKLREQAQNFFSRQDGARLPQVCAVSSCLSADGPKFRRRFKSAHAKKCIPISDNWHLMTFFELY